jgi:hypothetical protein
MPSIEPFFKAKNEIGSTTQNDVVPATQMADSPRYVELVGRYRSFAKHTAKNLVGLLATLMEAEAVLSTSEFERFCQEVKLAGSTLRKWKSMAKEASRFLPFVDQLPNNWTTLYRLARMKPDKYELVTRDASFGPSMTAKDIDIILHGNREPKGMRFAKLGIPTALSGSQRDDLARDLENLSQKYGIQVRLPAQKSESESSEDSMAPAWLREFQAE